MRELLTFEVGAQPRELRQRGHAQTLEVYSGHRPRYQLLAASSCSEVVHFAKQVGQCWYIICSLMSMLSR